jgi:hypothetical protein
MDSQEISRIVSKVPKATLFESPYQLGLQQFAHITRIKLSVHVMTVELS